MQNYSDISCRSEVKPKLLRSKLLIEELSEQRPVLRRKSILDMPDILKQP
jgi:hypothetical protein